MIQGTVNKDWEATIRLVVSGNGVAGTGLGIDAIIDTGFTGHLTLPMTLIDQLALSWRSRGHALLADGSLHVFDAYAATVLWNGLSRTVEVNAVETQPLVGMALLRGHTLRIDVVERGTVTIEPVS